MAPSCPHSISLSLLTSPDLELMRLEWNTLGWQTQLMPHPNTWQSPFSSLGTVFHCKPLLPLAKSILSSEDAWPEGRTAQELTPLGAALNQPLERISRYTPSSLSSGVTTLRRVLHSRQRFPAGWSPSWPQGKCTGFLPRAGSVTSHSFICNQLLRKLLALKSLSQARVLGEPSPIHLLLFGLPVRTSQVTPIGVGLFLSR